MSDTYIIENGKLEGVYEKKDLPRKMKEIAENLNITGFCTLPVTNDSNKREIYILRKNDSSD